MDIEVFGFNIFYSIFIQEMDWTEQKCHVSYVVAKHRPIHCALSRGHYYVVVAYLCSFILAHFICYR